MQFGLNFTHQLPRPWDEDAERVLFQNGLDQVELADQLNFDYAWTVEFHFLEEYSHSSAPEVFLAAASQRTSSIRLGHGIVLMPPAYNHPARVAERIATLDLVSNGRVDFGIGNSKSRVELEGFNVDPAQRHAMSLEALEQVTNMLAMEPYPGYQGAHFSMPSRNVVPKPVQRPHPPLWIACSNDATMHLAAQLGLGVLAHGFFDAEEAGRLVADYYETFKRECVPIGHSVNPNVAMLNPFYCHSDANVAMQRGAEAAGFQTYAGRHYYTFGRHRPGSTNVWRNSVAVRDALGADIPIRGGHAIGTPKQIATHLRAFQEVGVDQTILVHHAARRSHEESCESMVLFAEQVMPEFAEHETDRIRRKREDLAPYVEAAFRRKKWLPSLAAEEIPVVNAYGLSRPNIELSDAHNLSPSALEQLMELQKVMDLAARLES
jgi:alkanesulfonate monooxygenase SsuD/methylene tetrahydromethanopterin reductase-like flavin-dependent oxidoreductase (luciferase family)